MEREMAILARPLTIKGGNIDLRPEAVKNVLTKIL